MKEYLTTSNNTLYCPEPSELVGLLPIPSAVAHKGMRGRLVVCGGSKNFVGAPLLAEQAAADTISALLTYVGEAAMRSGAGLSTLAVPDFLAQPLYGRVTYSGIFPLTSRDGGFVFEAEQWDKLLRGADCLVLGCGAGKGDTNSALDYALERYFCKTVLDADGLNNIAERSAPSFGGLAVLTPHLGEFARLTGTSVLDIAENPVEIVREYAQQTQSVVVLKGVSSLVDSSYGGEVIKNAGNVKCSPSLISDGEDVYVNMSGNARLAKGGSGDVLAGVIGGLIAGGVDILSASLIGTYACGRCAELSNVGVLSYLPTDTIACLDTVFRELRENA